VIKQRIAAVGLDPATYRPQPADNMNPTLGRAAI
jgi:hypothetical protein